MKQLIAVMLSIAALGFAEAEPRSDTIQQKLTQRKVERAECMSRIKSLADQLKKMDALIEGNIEKTLEFAEKYTDSIDTNERIIGNKEQVLRDLMRATKHFAGLREEIMRQLASDRNYVKEDMIKILNWIDEKLKRRVQQITEVTTSLGGYEHYTDGYTSGGESVGSLIERAADEKAHIVREMRQAIEKLSKRSEKLGKELTWLNAKRSLDDINNELTEVNNKIETLHHSIEDIYNQDAAGNQIGERESREIIKEMRNRVSKLKSSSSSFFRNFDAMMRLLRKRKTLDIMIEKYEFAIEQLQAGS